MRFLANILLISLLIPFGSKAAGVLDYLISYEKYLEACENIDRPEMKCNGACQWAKEQQTNHHEPLVPAMPEVLSLDVFPFLCELVYRVTDKYFRCVSKLDKRFELNLFTDSISIDVPTPPPMLMWLLNN